MSKITLGQKREFSAEPTIGPGHYNPETKLTKPSAPVYSIEKNEQRQEHSPDNGPGTYFGLAEFTKDSKKMTIGRKIDLNHAPSEVGPGSYDLPVY